MEQYKAPILKESKNGEYVEYGEDNKYFQFLLDRYNNSTTNNAVINNIIKLIYGRGLDATDSNKKPNDYAQMMMLFRKDTLKKSVSDLKMLGQFVLQLIYNKKGDKIVKVEHSPIQNWRVGKCNEKGEIYQYFYSDNWDDVKNYTPKAFPAFGYGDKKLEILWVGNYTVGQKYYSNVDYLGALPYAKLEEEIADYLINEVQNSFSGTTVVNFNNGIPDEEKRQQISNEVKAKLTGSKGQKVIVSFNNDETKKTTVDALALNDAPQHYTYLSEESRSKILLAHGVVSGLQFGIPSNNGFSSNADELKNAFTLFDNLVIRPFQDTIIDALNRILEFNQVSLNLYFKTLQPLEFTDLNPIVDKATAEEETGVKLSEHYEFKPEEFGEDIDLNEWELIDSREVESLEKEQELDLELELLNNPKKGLMQRFWEFVSTGIARPNLPSSMDGKLFMSRYRYAGNQNPEREFCKKMMQANKLYRKEDIDRMSTMNVNPGFGMHPNPNQPYDIFLWKGGGKLSEAFPYGTCKHYWVRETYRRFIDPRRKGSVQVTPAEARKAGEILPTVDKRAYKAPHDM